MADNLAMAKPGHAVTMDGLHLSWPIGGERQVVYFPPERRTRRILNRIVNGVIVETTDEPTEPVSEGVTTPQVYTGQEARDRLSQPAAPVTRSQADPDTKTIVQVPVRSLNLPRVEAGTRAPNLTSMRKDQLVAYADERGIDSTGTKADILERLREDS